MSYQVTVFFDGPRSSWAKKLDDNEIIFHERDVRWLWLARRLARQNIGNRGVCSYVIKSEGKLVEQVNGPGRL